MQRFMLHNARPRLLMLAVLCTMAGAALATATDRALIVGVGKFADSSMDLPGIDLDVRLMQEVAERLGFNEIRTLTDADATYQGFLDLFETWLIRGTRADDRVLVYVSSHGSRVRDDNGDEPDGKDEALLLHDTRVRRRKLRRFLRDDAFSDLLRRLPSRNVLVLIDACHSGTAYKAIRLHNASLGESEARTKFFDYPDVPGDDGGHADAAAVDRGAATRGRQSDNFAFLSAAADDEQALATNKGSVFTLGLNAAVKAAAGAGRELTLPALREQVEAYIRNKIGTELSGSRMHRPQLGGNTRLVNQPLLLAVPQQGGRLWQQLEALAGRGAPLSFKAHQASYRVDDEVVFSLDVPYAGYLNVVNVGPQGDATVLFPNKHHRDNRVTAGSLTLPTDRMPFYYPALRPTGPTLTAAFLTTTELDLYEAAVEGRNAAGELTATLASLSAKAVRDVGVASRKDSRFAAGKVIFEVRE